MPEITIGSHAIESHCYPAQCHDVTDFIHNILVQDANTTATTATRVAALAALSAAALWLLTQLE